MRSWKSFRPCWLILKSSGCPDYLLRVALAVSLFRSAAVSAGFAARMAGKPLAEMLTLLSSQGIPLTGNDKAAADEARAEILNARDWIAKPDQEIHVRNTAATLFAAFALTVVAAMAGCGGGSGNNNGGSNSGAGSNGAAAGADIASPVTPPATQPLPSALATNSYANFKSIGLAPQTLPDGDNTMRAFGDFAGNGRLDLFRAVLTYDVGRPIAEATPGRFEFYNRQADGTFVRNTTLLPQSTGCLHPRKAIVADFNGDTRPDIFVACHGYDTVPFPGETNKIVLSQPGGGYVVRDASADVGFNHGAAAADLNGDGKIDVIVVNNFDPDRAYVLLNDGSGSFTRERTSRLPASIRTGNYYSIELVDINEDGQLDLIMGGHEFDAAPTSVFINPGSNNFSAVSPTLIPPVANEGVVLDFTVTGTSSTRALWVLRTSGGDGSFYQSKVIQKVTWPGLASSVVLNSRPARWIPWLVPTTQNGVAVVASDNASDSTSVPQ